MSVASPAIALGVAALVALAVARVATTRPPPYLMRENHAGRRVPVILGIPLGIGFVGGSFFGAAAASFGSDQAPVAIGMATGLVVLVLTFVGALDDRFGAGARGFGGHLRSLARGRPTTGILKLAVGAALAVLTALHLADDAVRITGVAVLLATCTNVWNALDVRPGRALKWAAVVLVPVVGAAWSRPSAPVLAAALGAVAALLAFDLRERGMLGDAGSNPLGFLVGLGLAVVLPTPWVVVAAAGALALQVAAETVTISRLIDAVPPLRWFDRLGRRTEAAAP